MQTAPRPSEAKVHQQLPVVLVAPASLASALFNTMVATEVQVWLQLIPAVAAADQQRPLIEPETHLQRQQHSQEPADQVEQEQAPPALMLPQLQAAPGEQAAQE